MVRKSLWNQLELAYAPLTAYEFAITKDDPQFEAALDAASLYIIGQRSVLTFENVLFEQTHLSFEIRQKGNSNTLKCKFPLRQKPLGSSNLNNIGVSFHFIDESTLEYSIPAHGVRGFSLFYTADTQDRFLAWFSPDKFLWNWWNEHIECDIQGDSDSFTRYHVHYVGKATKQNIVKRLNGHPTFQDILSLETTITEKQLPANEIIILAFGFRETTQVQTFGGEPDIRQMVAAVRGDNYPVQERIFLDVEKALIKAMRPRYNKQLFESYPVSKDGLYSDKYDFISYTLKDPITLVYNEGEIVGQPDFFDCDAIHIFRNQEFRLFKHK